MKASDRTSIVRPEVHDGGVRMRIGSVSGKRAGRFGKGLTDEYSHIARWQGMLAGIDPKERPPRRFQGERA